MEEKKFIFFRTFYDKELLRITVLILKKENIPYKVVDKSIAGTSRAPHSGYLEADIMVPEEDFDRVTEVFKF
jgi:hypothetical protein